MDYHQFTITIAEPFRDTLTRRLMELGSLGTAEQDAAITAYFPGSIDPGEVLKELGLVRSLLERLDGPVAMDIVHSRLPDADWNESWKKSFQPTDAGARFTIIPPWIDYRGGRIPIVIDPGMAFGTGHHETTRSCIVLMERYAPSVGRERFLDLGTGTGLLAIAARSLGFRTVIGIDTDPLAIEAARRNLALNSGASAFPAACCGVSERIRLCSYLENLDSLQLAAGSVNHEETVEVYEGDISSVEGTFDMIAANLISGTLIELAKDISERLRPGGMAVLSGILRGQDDEVVAAVERAALECTERLRDGKWVTIACRR